MSARVFLWRSGTKASSAAYPTGNNMRSFSFRGRSRSIWSRIPAFIDVLVTVTRPAFCKNKNIYCGYKTNLQWDMAHVSTLVDIISLAYSRMPVNTINVWHSRMPVDTIPAWLTVGCQITLYLCGTQQDARWHYRCMTYNRMPVCTTPVWHTSRCQLTP